MIQIMGQLFSNLCKLLCPKPRNETHPNYQTFYDHDDVHEKQPPPPQTHYINISDRDHLRPISGSSNRDHHDLGSSSVVPHIVVQFNEDDQGYARTTLKREDPSICYVDDQVILEKNVTTKVKYVSTSVTTDVVVRTLGPYTSAQRMLLVGEGDFSFSASLAVAFGTSHLKIVATSLNSEEFLMKNYRKSFPANKATLEARGSIVIHGIDATEMAKHPVLGRMVFDRIIFNFPHSGKFGKSDAKLRLHQKLVTDFLRNAKKMISEGGEIHITSKSNGFYRNWDIPNLGRDQGLDFIQQVRFIRTKYPGYQTKLGFGGDRYFNCNPSKTYKFALPDK